MAVHPECQRPDRCRCPCRSVHRAAVGMPPLRMLGSKDMAAPVQVRCAPSGSLRRPGMPAHCLLPPVVVPLARYWHDGHILGHAVLKQLDDLRHGAVSLTVMMTRSTCSMPSIGGWPGSSSLQCAGLPRMAMPNLPAFMATRLAAAATLRTTVSVNTTEISCGFCLHSWCRRAKLRSLASATALN